MISQQKDLEQLDGNISLNSANFDVREQEKPTEPTLAEDVLTLRLDLEYWTLPQNKAPPPTYGPGNITQPLHRCFGI